MDLFWSLILFPGIIIILISIGIFIFSISKYYKTKKKKYFILPACLLILYLYFSIVILAPITGQVKNGISGDPIADIKIERIVEIIPFFLNLGGNQSSIRWNMSEKTDKNGNYKMPLQIHFINPFFEIVRSVYMKVSPGEKYNNKPFLVDNKTGRFITSQNFAGTYYNERKINIFSKNRSYYFIPEINDMDECNNVIKDELLDFCQRLNAERLAIQKNDVELCHYLKFAGFACVKKVAEKYNDETKCNEIINIQENVNGGLKGKESLKDDCIRHIINIKKDTELCKQIPNSQWINAGMMFNSPDGKKKAIEDGCYKVK